MQTEESNRTTDAIRKQKTVKADRNCLEKVIHVDKKITTFAKRAIKYEEKQAEKKKTFSTKIQFKCTPNLFSFSCFSIPRKSTGRQRLSNAVEFKFRETIFVYIVSATIVTPKKVNSKE